MTKDVRVQRLTEARRLDGVRKQEACLKALDVLTSRGMTVTFAEIQRLANVSSWFVYNNAVVRASIEEARRLGTEHEIKAPPVRVDVAGLRADLADARDEIRRLREERDRFRQRVRQGLGAALEQRDIASVVERAESAERQRDLLQAELQDARARLAIAHDDVLLLREELAAARGAVKRMMRAPAGA